MPLQSRTADSPMARLAFRPPFTGAHVSPRATLCRHATAANITLYGSSELPDNLPGWLSHPLNWRSASLRVDIQASKPQRGSTNPLLTVMENYGSLSRIQAMYSVLDTKTRVS